MLVVGCVSENESDAGFGVGLVDQAIGGVCTADLVVAGVKWRSVYGVLAV